MSLLKLKEYGDNLTDLKHDFKKCTSFLRLNDHKLKKACDEYVSKKVQSNLNLCVVVIYIILCSFHLKIGFVDMYHGSTESTTIILFSSVVFLFLTSIAILCNRIFISKVLSSWISILEAHLAIGIVILLGLTLFEKLYSNVCPSNTFHISTCASLNLQSQFAMSILPLIPIININAFHFIDFEYLLLSWLMVISILLIYIIKLENYGQLFFIAAYVPLSFGMLYETKTQQLSNFFLHYRLTNKINELPKLSKIHDEEMSSLMGNMSHDFKTPMSGFSHVLDGIETSCQVFSLAFQSGLYDDDSTRQFINAMSDSTSNLKSINAFMLLTVNRFIDSAKAMKGVPLVPRLDNIQLLDTLDKPIQCMRTLQSRIQVEFLQLPSKLSSRIVTDKQWLLENVLCLLSNGVKYSTKSNVTIKLTLLASIKELSYEIHSTHSMYRDKETSSEGKKSSWVTICPLLMIEVEDHGIGLSNEKEQALFLPSKQVDRMTGGTGLGLFSLAKRVEAVQGYYGVACRKDRKPGSKFWFAIPYQRGEDQPTSLSSSLHLFTTSKSGARILSREASASSLLLPMESDMSSSCTAMLTASSCTGTITTNSSSIFSGTPRGPETFNMSVKSTDSSHKIRWNLSLERIDESVAATGSGSLSSSSDKHSSVAEPMTSRTLHSVSVSANTTSTAPVDATNLNILLVDDSPSILKMAGAMLTNHGHTVTEAIHGAEALDKIDAVNKQSSTLKKFDVIIMDLQMPIMDGFDCVTQLRELERQRLIGLHEHSGAGAGQRAGEGYTRQMIIACSANNDENTIEAAYKAGVDAFEFKPLTMDSFEAVYMRLKNQEFSST